MAYVRPHTQDAAITTDTRMTSRAFFPVPGFRKLILLLINAAVEGSRFRLSKHGLGGTASEAEANIITVHFHDLVTRRATGEHYKAQRVRDEGRLYYWSLRNFLLFPKRLDVSPPSPPVSPPTHRYGFFFQSIIHICSLTDDYIVERSYTRIFSL